MKKKRSVTIWGATVLAFLLIAFPAYLKWRREYGPPTEETLVVRAFLRNVDEVRVYRSSACSTMECVTAQGKPLFVLRGGEVKNLVNAIDFYEKPANLIMFGVGHPGNRDFVFVSKGKVTCRMNYVIREYNTKEPRFFDSDFFPPTFFGTGAAKNHTVNYFFNVLQSHNALTP